MKDEQKVAQIEVPELAGKRIDNLHNSLGEVQRMYDMSLAMLAEALGVPDGWILKKVDGRLLFAEKQKPGEEAK